MSIASINEKQLRETVDAITREFAGRGYFPSAVVRVFTRDQVLYTTTWGDVREDTLYDVASLTKIATATQVLLFADQGAFRLTDGILALLPELLGDALLEERLANVTIEKLLTHTSGIVDWYPFYAEQGDFAHVLGIALRRYGPVEGMVYSDLNFMLLGKVIERVTNLSLSESLTQRLARPFGLGKMLYNPDASLDFAPSCYGNPIEESMCAERGIAFSGWRPHVPTYGGANDGNAFYYFGGAAGSAGIFATAEAYQRLCQLHMNTDSPLLRSAQEAHAPGRGLGWQLGENYPEGCGHTGFTGTSMYLSRKLNIGVVAFTNRLFYPQPNPNATNDYRRALHQAVAAFFQ